MLEDHRDVIFHHNNYNAKLPSQSKYKNSSSCDVSVPDAFAISSAKNAAPNRRARRGSEHARFERYGRTSIKEAESGGFGRGSGWMGAADVAEGGELTFEG
jgi:hypothetical protein